MVRLLKNKSDATTEANTLGKLIIADARSTFEKLDDTEFLKKAMFEAAKAGSLNIMDVDIHRFEPHGITAIFVLKESHFSVHTWPEFGYFAVDIFSCGKEGDEKAAMDKFLEVMDAQETEVKRFERGILRGNERNLLQANSARQNSSVRKE